MRLMVRIFIADPSRTDRGSTKAEPAPLESLFEGDSMNTEASIREMGNQFADALSAWPKFVRQAKPLGLTRR